MVRIRKPNYFDKFKLKKMISFLSSEVVSQYTKGFINFPVGLFHEFLPLKLKFLPETYIIEEDKSILGLITVSPTPGNPYKLDISRLYLENDYFNAGKQLLEFVISKYGAKGASTFMATIDDSYEELLNLFVNGCGFRQCSSEQLWKMNTIHFEHESKAFIRPFKNSDAQSIAMLFNDSVITHFKYSISRTKNEYSEPFFYGLKNSYKFKYVIEDENLKTLKAYFSIITSDNLNYILDVTTSPWYECDWEDILKFTINQISRRHKEFYLFVKVKKYTTSAESFENYLKEKGFNFVQNKLVLVKDFYKLLKDGETSEKVLLFNGINEKPVFKI